MEVLLFSGRLQISEMYKEWQASNGLKDEPLTLLAYLESRGCLNIKKCKELINKGEN
jgi:hypothetical protein